MLLEIALSATVPLLLAERAREGGPTEEDWAWARQFTRRLGSHADILLYRGGKPGEMAAMFNDTARAIAILAFAPGGVTLFGQHWEAPPEP